MQLFNLRGKKGLVSKWCGYNCFYLEDNMLDFYVIYYILKENLNGFRCIC